jgi:serine/threonine protein kinase
LYEPGTVVLNKYRIEKLLGRSPDSEVYQVTHTILDVPWTLKVVRKTPRLDLATYRAYTQYFQSEAQLGTKIQHPNIIQAYEFEKNGDDLLLAMEFAPGGSLEERLKNRQASRQGAMAVEDVLRMAGGLAEALATLHRQGIVHRNLKPSNILFGEKGEAKLADLGLAQLPAEKKQRSGKGRAAPHPGTVAYMSPEQAKTTTFLTPASDIYSLGLVLFQTLTLRNYKDVLPGTLPTSLNPQVPEWLNKLVAAMLSEDPRKRPANGSVLATWLKRGRAYRPVPWRGIRNVTGTLAVIALALVAVWKWPVLFPPQAPQPTPTIVLPTATATEYVFAATNTPLPGPTGIPTRTPTPTPTPLITPTSPGPTEVLPCINIAGDWTGYEWVPDGKTRLPIQYEFSISQNRCNIEGMLTIIHQDAQNSLETYRFSGQFMYSAFYFSVVYVNSITRDVTYGYYRVYVLNQDELYSAKDTSFTPGYVLRLTRDQ